MEQKSYKEMFTNEDKHWWFVARRSILKKVLDQKLGNLTDAKILEAGCGTGGNLELLKCYGSLSAMELNDNAREMANSRDVCDVKKGKLPTDIPFNDEHDLICLLDVLEHINQDLDALETLNKLLKKGGKFLITVPAYQFLWSDHDEAHHHKRRYTSKSIRQLLQQAGLKINYISYFNTFLFPVILFIRLVNKVFRKKTGSDIAMPSPIVNTILSKIFSSEGYILPTISFPVGVSILVIAEKNQPN